jgi:hypothetical protein
MGTPIIRTTLYLSQRRSQRIVLSIPLLVTGKNTAESAFSERTATLVVNAHGGLILLREHVRMGQTLKLKNMVTDEEIGCTVVDISSVPMTTAEVGVEFVPPCPRFWRVSFPPRNWDPKGPEAKRYSSSPAPAAGATSPANKPHDAKQ